MRGLLQHWTDSSIILNSKEDSVWRNKRPRSRTVSVAEDRLLTWSMSTSGSQEPMILSRIMQTYLQLFFEMTMFRNSIQSGTEFYYQWQRFHLTTSWKDCTNWEYESLRNSRPYWNCMTWRFIRRKPDLIITGWRLWWKEVSSKKFEIIILGSGMEIMRRTPWSRIQGQNSVDNEFLEIVGSGNPTGSVLKETIAVSFTISISVQKWHSRIRLQILSCSRSRTRSPRGKSPSGRMSRWPCKDYVKGTCTNSFWEKWNPPECLFYKTKSGCRFGEKCSYAHRQVDEQPTKRSKKNDDKSAVAFLKKGDWQERGPVTDQCHDRSGKPDKRSDKKLGQRSSQRRSSDARQLGCVFQDMKPPKSILRKSSDMQKPIQRVKFTKVIARHTKIRYQNPSLGHICPGEPHERSPNAPKFEDRSQEETEWQEQGAREAAWRLVKSVLKLKEKNKAASRLRKIGACLHQLLNLRNENLLSTPARRCIWSAKRTWMMLKCDSHNRQWRSADAWRGNGVCQRIGHSWLWKSSKTRQQYGRLESFAMKTDILMNGSMVKNHISLKTGFGYSATRRTSFLLWFQACQVRPLDLHRLQRHLWDRRVIPHHLLQPHLLHLQ